MAFNKKPNDSLSGNVSDEDEATGGELMSSIEVESSAANI
jgi:hypothetical protein